MKVLIAGHNGMVGSSLKRKLSLYKEIEILSPDRSELDFSNSKEVDNYFAKKKPNRVFMAAAKVGGIFANNNYPVNFLLENIQIQSNVISACHTYNIERLVFFGSSCIYPKNISKKIKEEDLLSGSLEQTNEPYAIAKISGLKLCEAYNKQFGSDFRTLMPTNLCGPGDSYHPSDSHVIPALIKKIHEAKKKNLAVEIWGSGTPKREILHVDDLADAAILVMNKDKKSFFNIVDFPHSHINVGYGEDYSIKQIAKHIAEVIGFEGKFEFNNNFPDGVKRKLLDSSKINSLGWSPKINLKDALNSAYEDFLKRYVQ